MSFRTSRWLRSLSARVVLLNTVITVGLSGLMILVLCWLAEGFMQDHLDDTVLDEIRILEAEFGVDGRRGVQQLISRRLAENADGRQAYLLLDADGRRLAGNLAAIPAKSPSRADWYEQPTLHQPVDASLRLRRLTLADDSTLVVGFDDHEITAFVDALQRAAGLGFAATLLLGLVAGALSSQLTLGHLDIINRTATRIIEGDLGHRVPLRGSNDEFDRLSATLNEMLDRIGELMESVKRATESIAHDLRTPLARMRNRIEVARFAAPVDPAGQQELLDALCQEVDRVLTVFASLLRLATIESGVLRSGFQRVDLRPLVDDAISLYEALASEREIGVSLTIAGAAADGCIVDGDRDLLFQAICNLLDNAVKFSPDGGDIGVELALADRVVRICIDDRGPGVPVEHRERVFDRLVRLDHSRASPGFGLGLSLVRAIARLHRGDCHLQDGAPGTRALLELPQAS
ncbi:MAG: two-component sensor histidine kinase [Xanthomonadaceae bacterium]|nr:two-component sensor histidine kinase [Xanthomonadaceae bacterium]